MSNFMHKAAERFDNKTPLGVFYNFAICGPLAQLVEQRPFKAWVVGSSPTRLTMCPHRLAWPRTSPFQGGNAGSNPAGDATVTLSKKNAEFMFDGSMGGNSHRSISIL